MYSFLAPSWQRNSRWIDHRFTFSTTPSSTFFPSPPYTVTPHLLFQLAKNFYEWEFFLPTYQQEIDLSLLLSFPLLFAIYAIACNRVDTSETFFKKKCYIHILVRRLLFWGFIFSLSFFLLGKIVACPLQFAGLLLLLFSVNGWYYLFLNINTILTKSRLIRKF